MPPDDNKKLETTYDYIGSLVFRPNEPKLFMYLKAKNGSHLNTGHIDLIIHVHMLGVWAFACMI